MYYYDHREGYKLENIGGFIVVFRWRAFTNHRSGRPQNYTRPLRLIYIQNENTYRGKIIVT